MKNIHSILIANRGEIASRIIRTCRKMGIKSIAVFSEADRGAPYVEEADVGVFIGESSPAASYLDQDRIMEVAKKMKVDAIHPGYGFLAEHAGFAGKCAQEGIVFIGPNVAAIESMGSKSRAKALMQKHGVPVVPGYQEADQSVERLTRAALEIGFPVLLKATAGGGGKGMRIVQEENNMEKAVQAAKREAKNAFGNDELIIEKYISSGRHIEFQIFGDQHGNAIHILERECTIQRRYQKIIEESPSPVMTEKLRDEMGQAAVKAAKALNYDNAGTVEFIYDDQSGAYYFLEVNTRLQVEHPVTEELTGLDLVQMQIESAQGMPLGISQEEVKGSGYALEVRLYAEDPENNFLPVTGTIERFEMPDVEGLRVETAIRSGSEITIFYDPMIAKLIVWDKSRSAVHRKMQYVLKNLVCLGLTTNQDFLLQVLEQETFQEGNYNTHFVEGLGTLNRNTEWSSGASAIAAVLHGWQIRENDRMLLRSLPSGWRNSFYEFQKEVYKNGEHEMVLKYRFENGMFDFKLGEQSFKVQLIASEAGCLRVEIDDVQYAFTIAQKDHQFFIHSESFGNVVLTKQERFPVKKVEKIQGGYEAPMPSAVVKVLVEKGQAVKAGDGLIVLSSMKMETTIAADENGVVEEIYAEEGESVKAGFLLLKLTKYSM